MIYRHYGRTYSGEYLWKTIALRHYERVIVSVEVIGGWTNLKGRVMVIV